MDDAAWPIDQPVPQWSVLKIIAVWLVVVAPMAGLVLFIVPHLTKLWPDVNPGLIFWGAIIVGMAWQTVVSVYVLISEGQRWTWMDLRRALWLNKPHDPVTRRPAVWSLAILVPLGALVALLAGPAFGWLDTAFATMLPEWMLPSYGNIRELAVPENKGNWTILWFALVSSLFNYVLGEGLFFHCILLPRMQGAFGRFAWIANAVAFGGYHVHKIGQMPTIMVSCLCYSLPAQITRSAWPALLIHGVEAIWLLVIVMLVFLGAWTA